MSPPELTNWDLLKNQRLFPTSPLPAFVLCAKQDRNHKARPVFFSFFFYFSATDTQDGRTQGVRIALCGKKGGFFPRSARTELRIQHRKGWDGAGGDLSLSLLSQPSSRAAWSHHHHHHHHQRVTETPAKKPRIFMCHSVPHSSAWRVQRRRKTG